MNIKCFAQSLIGVLTLTVSVTVSMAGPYEGELTIEGLKAFVSENKISDPKEFIRLMPDRLRSNFTLMHHTKSMEAQCVNDDGFRNPRLIMFSPSDRIVVALTNNSKIPECKNPVVLEIKKDGEMSFDFIPLHQNEINPILMNKSRCLGCHGKQSPSPIWGAYPLWLGAYGSNDDFLPLAQDEMEAYQANIANWRKDGIYSSLKWGQTLYYPYTTQHQVDFMLRPNFRLTIMLARWNAVRIAKNISVNPSFQEKKREFFRSHLSCDQKKISYRQVKRDELAAFGSNVNKKNINNDFKVGKDDLGNTEDYVFVELLKLEAKGQEELLGLLQNSKTSYGTRELEGITTQFGNTFLAKDEGAWIGLCEFLSNGSASAVYSKSKGRTPAKSK